MAKFYGVIGYGESVETAPGVVESVITERKAFGDVLRNSRQMESGEKVNPDISVSNSISVVADAYAKENFFAIRYITWMGVRWQVQNVQVDSPRLNLTLGGLYNGPTPTPPAATVAEDSA